MSGTITTPSHTTSPRRRVRLKIIAPAVSLILLAGCAGAKVENSVMSAPAKTPAPSTIYVDVDLAPDARAEKSAGEIATKLQGDIIKRYRKAGLTSAVAAEGGTVPGTATLHVKISKADPGDAAQRLLIGFGAGKASLMTDVTFDMADGAALTMSTTSKGRNTPGMIMPGAISAVTGDIKNLLIGGGIKLALSGNSGIDKEADKTAKAIVSQTEDLYAKVGWMWPDA